MIAQPSAPHTPEEIAAAKSYLRETFAHAVENFEKFVEIETQNDDTITPEEIEAARHALKLAAEEVAKGSLEGEKALDYAIKKWQGGYLPDLMQKNWSPS